MRIESITSKPDRAGRYKVTFEGGTTMRLYRQTVEDHGLYPGLELSVEQMSALRTDAGAMSAKMRAVRIVSASSVSRQDLQQRLVRKGESETQAKEAVEWMEELKLLDDRETAYHIVSRCAGRGYGPARAKQMLYEKQIPREFWDEALEDYPDQTEHIMNFLHSRLGERWESRDLKRAIDALLRRGYSYGDIRRCLQRLSLDEDELLEE
jgi:regulatory protein